MNGILPLRLLMRSVALVGMLAGCDSNYEVKQTLGPGAEYGDMRIDSVKPMAARPGEVVTVLGTSIPEGATATFNGQDITLNIINDTEANFTVPKDAVAGRAILEILKETAAQDATVVIYNPGEYPLITADAAQICLGQKFYNAKGDLVEGSRDCSGSNAGDCTASGQVGCVTTQTVPSVMLSEVLPENILLGKSIAGVNGTVDLSNALPQNIANGVAIAGVMGTAALAPANCSSDGETACVANASFRAADMSRVLAPNIASGITIAGVPGNYAGSNPACSADGETGCVTSPTFKAADMSMVLAANVRNGITIAGVSGTYPSLLTPLNGATGTADLVSMAATTAAGSYEFFDSTGARYTGAISDAGAVTPTTADQQFNTSLYRQFTVNGDTDLVTAKIKSGVNIFGVVGNVIPSPSDCISDGDSACVVTGNFKAANVTSFVAGDVKSGKTIAGIAGSLANCSADGSVGCVATSAFKAADMNNITPANIKSGVTIAGVSGDFPSVTNPLSGALGGIPDLDSTNFLTQIKSSAAFEYWNSAGQRFTGNGDLDLIASNIKLGADIFGEVGTVVPTAANCSSNGQTGCVTTATYQAADLSSLVPGNIKSGVTIAGVGGTYPSLLTPLAGATGTADLVSLAANTAAGTYEFFDSTGTRYSGSISNAGQITPNTSTQNFNASLYRAFSVEGDANLNASNIRGGISIFGVTGSLAPAPANCALNGQTNCVANSTFQAADLSNLTDSNIKAGVIIAGVSGIYPSGLAPLSGATGMTDLPAFVATVGGTTYEWFRSDGTRITGTVEADATVTPTTSDQTLSAGLYRSISVNGDSDLTAGNIKTGVNIFGVNGNVTPSAAACSSDAEVGCVTTTLFKAVDMSNVIASNIKDTVVIAGVTGNLSGSPVNCSSNGQQGCVTTATYKAADLTNLTAGNIKNGVTIAGTAGTYPSLTTPLTGATGTSDLVSMSASTAAGTYEFFDSTGTRYTGDISDAATVIPGVSNQSFNTSLYRQFTVTGDADLAAANIKTGVNIFGVNGTLAPSPANCSSDGESACVATSTYKAANTAGYAASDIKFGKTIAGVAGSLIDCNSDGGTACVANSSYKAVNMTNVTAANIKSGVVLAGVTGDFPSATNPLSGNTGVADLDSGSFATKVKSASAFEYWDSAGNYYTGNGDADIIAANIKTGVDIFGAAGSVVPSAANCSANGQTGCVTTATYQSADLTNLSAGNIKNGVSIAGVSGSYPSVGTPLNGATATNDLVSMSSTTAAGSYEFFDSAGTRYTGSITDAGTITPGASNQTFSASLYRQFTVNGDADLVAGNIKNTIDIFGVTGNVIPTAANCTGDNQVGCVTTATYKSADTTAFAAGDIKSGKTIAGVAGSLANCTTDGTVGCVTTSTYKSANLTNVTAGNIKSGVLIAGVTGDYPSATYPLPSASGVIADLDGTTFNAKMKSATAFEYWDSAGNRYTGAGDADIAAANIVSAIDIFGATGSAAVESHTSCNGDNQTGCIATAPYKTADTSNFAAGDIVSGKTIAGVAGSLATCTTDGTTGCVTTATYKSANMTNATVGNIKSGVTIAGVTGAYPNATYTLPGASGSADLDSSTFNAKVKSATAFEYWDSTGARYTGNGDANITAAKIRNGVSIFGTTGTYSGPSAAPTGLTIAQDVARLTNSWNAGTFTGFLLVRRTGTAVTWTPTDGNVYSAGSLDANHTAVYVGSSTSYNDGTVTNGNNYYYALYGYDASQSYSYAATSNKLFTHLENLDFEKGTLTEYTLTGSYNWTNQTTTVNGGIYAARSGNITDSQSSCIERTVNTTNASGSLTLTFWWRVSSESSYDYLRFYIDGSQQNSISGSTSWAQKTYSLSNSSNHILKWCYTKDASNTVGSDAGWIDDIVLQ